MANGEPVTQRQLLEQNTELTKLIYETVGQTNARLNDISDRLSNLEGRKAGEDAQDASKDRKTSIGIYRAGLVMSSALSVAALAVGLVH